MPCGEVAALTAALQDPVPEPPARAGRPERSGKPVTPDVNDRYAIVALQLFESDDLFFRRSEACAREALIIPWMLVRSPPPAAPRSTAYIKRALVVGSSPCWGAVRYWTSISSLLVHWNAPFTDERSSADGMPTTIDSNGVWYETTLVVSCGPRVAGFPLRAFKTDVLAGGSRSLILPSP
jgi:hypothetical protein